MYLHCITKYHKKTKKEQRFNLLFFYLNYIPGVSEGGGGGGGGGEEDGGGETSGPDEPFFYRDNK